MKTAETEYTNEIILNKLIESCLEFNSELFLPYLQSQKVITDMSDKIKFYWFFRQMLLIAKETSIDPMNVKIEKPNWEMDKSIAHYNLYDSLQKHPQLCILVQQSANKIYLETMPF